MKQIKLEAGTSVLLVLPDERYMETLSDTLLGLSKQFKNTCYVTLNTPYVSLMRLFTKRKIPRKNVLVIDAVTKAVQAVTPENDHCIYVESQSSLTHLSLAITKAVETVKFQVVVIDSISTLFIYNNPKVVERFIHFIVQKMRQHNVALLLVAIGGNENNKELKQMGMFVDEVVHLD
jgi:KaiC/GvpD/RAD55 family RecA-like ATPase